MIVIVGHVWVATWGSGLDEWYVVHWVQGAAVGWSILGMLWTDVMRWSLHGSLPCGVVMLVGYLSLYHQYFCYL